MKDFLALVVALSLLCGPVADAFAAESDCSLVKTAMDVATKLRGLSAKRSVPCRLQNKAQVEAYLRETIRTKIPPDRIANEGKAYKMLGLIPEDYDYLEGLIALYTSQLGGYYDADKDYYAMADWMPQAMQMPIAVHELTHALQDQHFVLDNLLDQKAETSDALMARSALVEGDATAVMLDHARSLMGQPSLATEASVSGLMMQNIAGAMLSSALHNAPSSLQAILVFPYVSGLHFAHAILRNDGYAGINRAFSRLPSSTEEILHPEKYFAGRPDFETLEELTPPEHLDLGDAKPVFSDRVGEFVTSTLLGMWLSPQGSSAAATGWGGDRLLLFAPEGRGEILVWFTRWDTTRDAEEFFAALTAAYAKRLGVSVGTATGAQGSYAHPKFGAVKIAREGQFVTLTVGG